MTGLVAGDGSASGGRWQGAAPGARSCRSRSRAGTGPPTCRRCSPGWSGSPLTASDTASASSTSPTAPTARRSASRTRSTTRWSGCGRPVLVVAGAGNRGDGGSKIDKPGDDPLRADRRRGRHARHAATARRRRGRRSRAGDRPATASPSPTCRPRRRHRVPSRAPTSTVDGCGRRRASASDTSRAPAPRRRPRSCLASPRGCSTRPRADPRRGQGDARRHRHPALAGRPARAPGWSTRPPPSPPRRRGTRRRRRTRVCACRRAPGRSTPAAAPSSRTPTGRSPARPSSCPASSTRWGSRGTAPRGRREPGARRPGTPRRGRPRDRRDGLEPRRRRGRAGAGSAGTRLVDRQVVGRRSGSSRAPGAARLDRHVLGRRAVGLGALERLATLMCSAVLPAAREAASSRRRRRRHVAAAAWVDATSRPGARGDLLAWLGDRGRHRDGRALPARAALPQRARRVLAVRRDLDRRAAARAPERPRAGASAPACSSARRCTAGPAQDRFNVGAVHDRDQRGAGGVRRARLAARRRCRQAGSPPRSRWPASRSSTRCSSGLDHRARRRAAAFREVVLPTTGLLHWHRQRRDRDAGRARLDREPLGSRCCWSHSG